MALACWRCINISEYRERNRGCLSWIQDCALHRAAECETRINWTLRQRQYAINVKAPVSQKHVEKHMNLT